MTGTSIERPAASDKEDSLLAAALQQPGATRRASGAVKFQCPACAVEGHDRHEDNAVYFPQFRTWGCAWAANSPTRAAHRTAIAEVLGASDSVLAPPAVGAGKPTQAQRLLVHAEGIELFHDPDVDVGYATIPRGNHRETWAIRSKSLKRFIVRRSYQAEGKPPSAQAVADVLGVLEARAQFDGAGFPVHLRVAGHGDTIYLDLVNDRWEVVEITVAGWQVISDPPVKFRRAHGMLRLPNPERGGTLDELRPHVNVGSEADWQLLIGWLVGTVRPIGPYPVLVLNGEQGSAKSSTARVLRAVVDPNQAGVRGEPRDAHDLMIAARNARVLAYDNLSFLHPWLSDAFCRLATGGGFGTRELYTDTDEILFNAQRPVILNGIEEVVTRGDLLDRAIILYCPRIDDSSRRTEEDLANTFATILPRVLGALLDAVSMALRNRGQVRLSALPRMADFAMWVAAAEPALTWPAGAFLRAYRDNRTAANDLALEASPLAGPLRTLADRGGFRGTAAEILGMLNKDVDESVRRARSWPKTPVALSNALRRLAPNLRESGIPIEFGKRSAKKRPITIGPRRQPSGRSRQPNGTRAAQPTPGGIAGGAEPPF